MGKHIPNMFLGVGAGRCGSQSLARILDESNDVDAHHEAYIETDRDMPDVVKMFDYFREGTGDIIGHTGALWLGFVPLLRLQFPGLPIICLHRDMPGVIDSFMRRDAARRRKWLINISGTVDRLTPEYLTGHWRWCENLMRNIAQPVLHLDTDELNGREGLEKVYDFLGVMDRPYPVERRHHVGLSGMDETTMRVVANG